MAAVVVCHRWKLGSSFLNLDTVCYDGCIEGNWLDHFSGAGVATVVELVLGGEGLNMYFFLDRRNGCILLERLYNSSIELWMWALAMAAAVGCHQLKHDWVFREMSKCKRLLVWPILLQARPLTITCRIHALAKAEAWGCHRWRVLGHFALWNAVIQVKKYFQARLFRNL